jgi:hypothetical protein
LHEITYTSLFLKHSLTHKEQTKDHLIKDILIKKHLRSIRYTICTVQDVSRFPGLNTGNPDADQKVFFSTGKILRLSLTYICCLINT